jgi:hypothetical protein
VAVGGTSRARRGEGALNAAVTINEEADAMS